MSSWDTEKDEQKPEYQVKAHVVLEDSDVETWGMAKCLESSFSRESGETVGTWSKSPIDKCYHVFLESPITALVDKATQLHAELVRKRREGIHQPIRSVAKPSPPDTSAFDDIRKKLRGGL